MSSVNRPRARGHWTLDALGERPVDLAEQPPQALTHRRRLARHDAHLEAEFIRAKPAHNRFNANDLLRAADAALYRAKGEGRNRVHLVQPGSLPGSAANDTGKRGEGSAGESPSGDGRAA